MTPPTLTPALASLLGFAGWVVLLVLAILLARGVEILRGKTKLHEFPSGIPHGGDRYWRLNRAHANALENLPLFAVVVLTGTVLGVDTPWFGRLAELALAARVVQSIVHVAANTQLSVSLRFTGLAVQLVCFAGMALEIVRARS